MPSRIHRFSVLGSTRTLLSGTACAVALGCSIVATPPTSDDGAGGATNSPASGGASSAGGTTTGGTTTSAGGAAGAGGMVSVATCEKAGVLFCEDFESSAAGAVPGAPWTVTTIGLDGRITIDATTPAKSGIHSAKVESLGNYQTFLTLTGAPVFAEPRDSLYVRAFLRLSEPMTGGHNTYFKAGAAGASSSEHETRVGVMLEMLMINQPAGDRGVLANENYWTDMVPGASITEETWTCVEGFFDPPNSTVSFSIDGVDIPDLHVTDWQQDPLGALHFGFEQYAGPTTVLWYDDIVVSTEPIGCD